MRRHICVAVSLLVVAGFTGMSAPVRAANAPFIIFPKKPVDERLFLVQALAQMYKTCLGCAQNTNAFNTEVAVWRPMATRLLRHIYNQNLGNRLATLYRGYLKNMDSLKNYNESIAANMSEAEAARGNAKGKLFLQTFGTGFAAGGIANAHPVVAIGSALYGLYKAWSADGEADEKISDAERAAIDAARRNLRDGVNPRLMHAQALVNQLAGKYGWSVGSTGFEMDVTADSPSSEYQMKERDPFYAMGRAFRDVRQIFNIQIKSHVSFFAPTALTVGIYDTAGCLKAEQMIPANHIYDRFRIQDLAAASLSALIARGNEQNLGINPLGSTAISQIDVGLYQMLVEYVPSKVHRELYAASLGANNQVNAALRETKDLTTPLGSDPDFCYLYACLCSRAGSFDNAIGWLTTAIANGYSHVGGAWRDPDLTALRKAHPNQFHNLLYPSVTYTVNPGQLIGDDAVLTNSSRFAITNVTLTIATSSGAALTLTVPEIPAGGTKTWSNCANAGALAGSTATYNCDQLKNINRSINHTQLALKNDIAKHHIINVPDNNVRPAPGYCWVSIGLSDNRVISGPDADLIGVTLMHIGYRYSTDPTSRAVDFKEALSWYHKGAAAGNGLAMYHIGMLYDTGQGVQKDYTKAIKWYRLSAAAGNGDAMNNIGYFYKHGLRVRQDYTKMMGWFRKGAAAGSGKAMYNIGMAYANGQGVPKDYTKAIAWYRKAAAAGIGVAMNNIGMAYFDGQGVPQDYSKGMTWLRKAAARGDDLAMNNIGAAYESGLGVPKDYTKAIAWYRKAAAVGCGMAMGQIGVLYEFGKGVPQDNSKAMKWLRKAEQSGDPRAAAEAERAVKYLPTGN